MTVKPSLAIILGFGPEEFKENIDSPEALETENVPFIVNVLHETNDTLFEIEQAGEESRKILDRSRSQVIVLGV